MDKEKALEILQLTDDGKLTKRAVRLAFRKRCFDCHTDIGGSTEAFTMLKEAQRVATLEVIFLDGPQEKLFTVDGTTRISDLGKGYPIAEPARTCEVCSGHGYREYTLETRLATVKCDLCNGIGVFSYACNKCSGSGRFVQANSKREVSCRACNGTGRFYPINKEAATYIFSTPVLIPGTNKAGYRCKRCSGAKLIQVRVPVEKGFIKCDACSGIGEIKMWNPVIPRGFLQSGG